MRLLLSYDIKRTMVARPPTKLKASLVLLSVLALLALSALTFLPSVSAATVSDTTDCPNGVSAAINATSGNSGTGFVVGFTGSAPGTVQYGVVIPANSNLVEYCVYPNGGNVGSVTTGSGNCPILSSQTAATSTLISDCSTGITNWKAGFDCGSYTCVESQRDTGTATVFGPTTVINALTVNYTSSIQPVDCSTTGDTCIILHVSDEGSGVCSTSGTLASPTTCFIIPAFSPIFPPPPVGVPQFPLAQIGLSVMMAVLIPALLLLRRRTIVGAQTTTP